MTVVSLSLLTPSTQRASKENSCARVVMDDEPSNKNNKEADNARVVVVVRDENMMIRIVVVNGVGYEKRRVECWEEQRKKFVLFIFSLNQ